MKELTMKSKDKPQKHNLEASILLSSQQNVFTGHIFLPPF
jgi:hypothetical protein